MSIRGNMVNVPADVNNTVKNLPRTLNDSETIQVQLKRKKEYQHYVACSSIRPNKCLDAVRWLITHSQIYRDEGITLNENWIQDYNVELDKNNDNRDTDMNCESVTDDSQMSDLHGPSERNTTVSQSNEENTISNNNESDVIDHWTEVADFDTRPVGNMDTLLHPIDFREIDRVLVYAPGEGKSPVSVFQDKYAEFLAFPTIYCGQSRQNNNARKLALHYSSICKWELRNVDRRVAMNVANIFFKLKKLQIKQIQDKVSLSVRKCKFEGKKLTAGDVLKPGGVDNILKLNEGYKVLRSLRGSPPYWEKAKRDIFAMIRQLGLPTFFCSLSAAETKWHSLLHTLGTLVHNRNYSEEEITNMTWQKKCELIKSDPVTCARYFDYRIQQFFIIILKSSSSPVGEIIDFFYRVEFQQRGSPHIHMLLWIKNAPSYPKSSKEVVTEFIDSCITCQYEDDLKTLINYQLHRHAQTCRKKGKDTCRFGFPIPPMKSTEILEPLPEEEKTMELKVLNSEIVNALQKMKLGDDISFEQFLEMLNVDYENYLKAIRVTLTTTKVSLKRQPSEIRINPYNKTMLQAWEANLDIQFILDPYACASYIVSYISKGQRGMSNLLHDAVKQAKEDNDNIRQQVRKVGNKFLTHVELSAQEAVYIVLQMPLRRSSRSFVYINTNEEDERTHLLKDLEKLKDLRETSTDIVADNHMKRYTRRPKKLESCTLAKFFAWYEVQFREKEDKKATENIMEELPEVDYKENLDDDGPETLEEESDEEISSSVENIIEMKNGIILRRRKKAKIIQYRGFNKSHDSENYYREQLMLYVPWRNEKKDIISNYISYESRYGDLLPQIEKERKLYTNDVTLEELGDTIEENDTWDDVAPNTVHNDNQDSAIGSIQSQLFSCFNPGKSSVSYDIGMDLGNSRKQIGEHDILPNVVKEEEYQNMVQNLNEKQKEFFYHILHWFKEKDDCLYCFLSGGAGVGKSVVTTTIYHGLMRYYNSQPGGDPDTIKILLCAPTGKAAYNIKGSTIHSTFCIPIGQGFSYKPLDSQQLSIMRVNIFI